MTPGAEAVIQTDIAELLESGCALIVGTVDAAAVPDATRGWGAQVLPDGVHVRVLVAADATTSLANLRSPGAVALTATDVSNYRSVQAKGTAVAVEPATDEDRRRRERFTAAFFGAVHDVDGTPEELLAQLPPAEYAAFVMTVEDLFDQTPGPSAGARLETAGP